MVKPERTKLENIQEGSGKDIARLFFKTYRTPSQVTKIKYNNAWRIRNEKSQRSFVMPIVQKHLSDWKKEGFIETSRIKIPVRVERKKGKPYNLFSAGFLMNLEPIYLFFKKEGYELTPEEKQYLKINLLFKDMRKEILKEYPKEDIIHATIKYYTKNTIMKYFFLLKDIRENKEKYDKQFKKVEELNNPKSKIGKEMKTARFQIINEIHKKYDLKKNKLVTDFDIIKVVAYQLPITNSNFLLQNYLSEKENDNKFIEILDNKMLKALQICP